MSHQRAGHLGRSPALIVAAFAAAALLTGGTPPGFESTDEVPLCGRDRPVAFEASGTVAGYAGPAGEVSVRLMASGSEAVVATGSITDSGTFSVVLPAIVDDVALVAPQEVMMYGIDVSSPTALVNWVEFIVEVDGESIGALVLASWASASGPSVQGDISVEFMYASDEVHISGVGVVNATPVGILHDLSLVAGWNLVEARLDLDAPSLTTRCNVEGLEWYFTPL